MMLVNMLEGGFISEHDYEIAVAHRHRPVRRRGRARQRWSTRSGCCDLEREHFVELAQMQKTQERIEHMLKTGKPLRN